MGLFDFEDRLDKELEFILLIQKIIEENIRQKRVLVIVTGEYWAKNNNSELLGRGINPSFNLSLYPKPINYGYGHNFSLNMIELFKEKGDMVLFNPIENILESHESQQWIYLINLAAKGERIVYNNELKFVWRIKRTVALIKIFNRINDNFDFFEIDCWKHEWKKIGQCKRKDLKNHIKTYFLLI